jgi:hypothetical protein
MAAGGLWEDGVARGAMGADAGDYDGSGRPHLLVKFFQPDAGPVSQRRQRTVCGRSTFFRSDAPPVSLTFGAFFFDYDLDGHLDIFSANGHIEEEIGRVQPKVSYRQAPLLFRNLGKGNSSVGAAWARPSIADRGAGGVCGFRPRWRSGILLHQSRSRALGRNDGGTGITGWCALTGTKSK